MKFKLEFGNYEMTIRDVFSDTLISFECYIGCIGNQVFTDSLGNRYVPYSDHPTAGRTDVDAIVFSECRYMVIAANGALYELVGVEELENL